MNKILVCLLILFAAKFPVAGQTPRLDLDLYLATGKTIVVAKCLSVGPVNILLRARVEVQILHVVKGKETPRRMTVISEVGMEEGKTYLLKTENDAVVDRPYFTVENIDSAILMGRHEDIEELRKLSPRIVVLRTMNLRVDQIKNEMRRLNDEMEALTAARKETR